MLVEDNPADAMLVREALEEHHVRGELILIADGESAVDYMEQMDHMPNECPDLAIIDLNVPKRSGREVLAAARLSNKCRQMPIVILSSSDATQDREDSMRLGASRYIPKPSRLEEFLDLGRTFKAMAGSA